MVGTSQIENIMERPKRRLSKAPQIKLRTRK
jgi:hypothetical protein